MHVGACVLQKLRKLGGRGQNFGFYTKIAQKGLLSTHRGGKWCPNGVLMTSTCSGHGYYKMASKLGPKSKPFWKYLGLTARARALTSHILGARQESKGAWPMITMPICSGHGYYKMASKLGLKSKPFWKYLGLTARARAFTNLKYPGNFGPQPENF